MNIRSMKDVYIGKDCTKKQQGEQRILRVALQERREESDRNRDAKRAFDKKLAKNTKKDSKSFYAYYREKNRSRVGIGPLEDADGQRVTDELEQATILN